MKNKVNQLLVAIIALLVIALAVLGLQLLDSKDNIESNQDYSGTSLHSSDIQQGSLIVEGEDKLSDEEIQQMLNDRASETGFALSVNSIVIVDKETMDAELLIENTASNNYSCQVDVVGQNNEIYYQSDVIDPGYYIDIAKLDMELAPGDYPAQAVFNILNSDGSVKSKAIVEIELSVE